MRQLLPHISFATESCSSKKPSGGTTVVAAFDEAWLFFPSGFRPSQKISSSLPKRGNLVKVQFLLKECWNFFRLSTNGENGRRHRQFSCFSLWYFALWLYWCLNCFKHNNSFSRKIDSDWWSSTVASTTSEKWWIVCRKIEALSSN